MLAARSSTNKPRFLSFQLIFGCVFFLGSFSHLVEDAGQSKVLNLAVVVGGVVCLGLYALHHNLFRQLPRSWSALFLFTLLFWMVAVSVFRNSPDEWIPSATRYTLYLLVLLASYHSTLVGRFNELDFRRICQAALAIGVIAGLAELLIFGPKYVNGAFRISGHFPGHYLAYSLYLFVPLVYVSFDLIRSFSWGNFVLWSAGVFLLFGGHSRVLMVMFLFSLFAPVVVYSRGVFAKLWYVGLLAAIMVAFLLVVINTDYFPRLREFAEFEELDSSTSLRLFIWSLSLKSASIIDLVVGIGAGGFNEFFGEASGMWEVAAHNDYFLVLIEGGVFSLALYLIYQGLVVLKMIRVSRSHAESTPILYAAFSCFFTFEIAGFLLNVHYFYQSEVLLCLLLGFFFGSLRRKRDEEFSTFFSTERESHKEPWAPSSRAETEWCRVPRTGCE